MARFFLALAFLLLNLAASAEAHLTPNSELGLDFGRSRVDASLIVPLGELQYAEPRFAGLRPGALATRQRAALTGWLLEHIAATAPDGRRWTLNVTDIAITSDAAPDLTARIAMLPPRGAPLRHFTLAYSALIDRLPNHFVLVMLRTDFDAGHLSEHPQMLGGLRRGAQTVLVDRGPGSGWRGFKGAVGLGMSHIAEGHDHLLFLIALLLPAPLLAEAGRWRGYGGARKTVRALVAIVTAFTIGHSLTLIGGAFLGWQLPVQPVETLIALSILISAAHAFRPLFAGREALVAGGFGLVHGMAFATVIGRFGVEPWQKAQSILGFNLGIELIQLLVVALTVPGLAMLARTSLYPGFRAAMAIATGIAAGIWMIERIGGHDVAAGRAIDAVLDYSPWLLAASAGAALLAIMIGRFHTRPAAASPEANGDRA